MKNSDSKFYSITELSTTKHLEKRERKWVWKIVIQNFIHCGRSDYAIIYNSKLLNNHSLNISN